MEAVRWRWANVGCAGLLSWEALQWSNVGSLESIIAELRARSARSSKDAARLVQLELHDVETGNTSMVDKHMTDAIAHLEELSLAKRRAHELKLEESRCQDALKQLAEVQTQLMTLVHVSSKLKHQWSVGAIETSLAKTRLAQLEADAAKLDTIIDSVVVDNLSKDSKHMIKTLRKMELDRIETLFMDVEGLFKRMQQEPECTVSGDGQTEHHGSVTGRVTPPVQPSSDTIN